MAGRDKLSLLSAVGWETGPSLPVFAVVIAAKLLSLLFVFEVDSEIIFSIPIKINTVKHNVPFPR